MNQSQSKYVIIWDMDFFYEKSFLPSATAMKISSFHKQLGDSVSLVLEEDDLKFKFDLLYIIRESRHTEKPSSALTDDTRSRLVGKAFRFNPNQFEIDEVIAACRPDYSLYPEPEPWRKTKYSEAQIAQFFFQGKLLKNVQPFEHPEGNKPTLIADDSFWDASEKDILFCFEILKNYKNIGFLEPISLKKIINNPNIRKNFLNLKLGNGIKFKFVNDYGSTYEDARVLIDFVAEMRKKNKTLGVTMLSIPFKSMLEDHWVDGLSDSAKKGLEDFERCLKIIDYGKQNLVQTILVAPTRRKMGTPFWYYFEPLEIWTERSFHLSFIEFMLRPSVKQHGEKWYVIINNSTLWTSPNSKLLIELFLKQPDLVEKYCYREMGEKFLNRDLINKEKIKEYGGVNNE